MLRNKFISFDELRKKLSNQMRKNRDKAIREKVELFYLASKLQNVKEACARRGVTRDFFYTWWRRLRESKYKIESLRPRSRRPKTSPRKIPAELEIRIRYLRKIHGEGAEMLLYRLQKEGHKISKSTVQYVLNRRRSLRSLRKVQLKAHRKRYELPIPGCNISHRAIIAQHSKGFIGGFTKDKNFNPSSGARGDFVKLIVSTPHDDGIVVDGYDFHPPKRGEWPHREWFYGGVYFRSFNTK